MLGEERQLQLSAGGLYPLDELFLQCHLSARLVELDHFCVIIDNGIRCLRFEVCLSLGILEFVVHAIGL